MSAISADSMLSGSNLVSFSHGVAAQERADILDVLLLAELTASERHDRVQEWEQWVAAYQAVLTLAGLTPQGELAQKPVRVSSEREFRRESAKLVQTIRPRQLAAVAESSLAKMFASEHARVFFSTWFGFSAGRSDSFQIVPCERGASGKVNIAACGLQMVTRTRIRLPFIGLIQNPHSYRMTLTFKGGNFVYEQNRYAPHRARVQRETAAKAIESILRIDL
jgi:hypothetical protein